MKIEIAPAGTNPTKERPTQRVQGGWLDLLRSNAWVLAAVGAFVVVGLLAFRPGTDQQAITATGAEPQAATQSVPVPGFCEYGAILVRDGETVNIGGTAPGGRWVSCEHGEIVVVPISAE